MIRALTIRFAIVCLGLSVLVVSGNLLHASPGLAGFLLFAYLIAGVLIIGNYCVDHEDEIPTRAERRRNWRG
jgi:hypothetical protein